MSGDVDELVALLRESARLVPGGAGYVPNRDAETVSVMLQMQRRRRRNRSTTRPTLQMQHAWTSNLSCARG